MNSRSKYNTRQKEDLLAYLESTAGSHITAADVCEHFRELGSPISQATVYRRLEKLVDEGIIGKYTIDVNSPACFEYMGEHSHSDEGSCFHCKCSKCGRLIHMHCDELDGIGEHLLEHHGFMLDPRRTVFYGLCGECMDKEAARP